MNSTPNTDKAIGDILNAKAINNVTKPKRERSVRKQPKEALPGWDGIGKGIPQKRQNVAKWKPGDFRIHMSELYVQTFNQPFPFTFTQTYRAITKVEVSLGRFMNLPDGVAAGETLKSYFDFYFARHAQNAAAHNSDGKWKLGNLGHVKAFGEFASLMSTAFPAPATVTAPAKVAAKPLKKEDVESSAMLGKRSLAMEFGLMIAANWSIGGQKTDEDKGKELSALCEELASAIKRQGAKRCWPAVVAATENYNPYPKWLMFKNMVKIVEKVQNLSGVTLTPIKIELAEDDGRFGFLR